MEPISDLKINIRRPKFLSGSNYCKRTSHAQNSCDGLLSQAREDCLLRINVGRVTNQKRQNLKIQKTNTQTAMVTALTYEHASSLIIIDN